MVVLEVRVVVGHLGMTVIKVGVVIWLAMEKRIAVGQLEF